MTADRPSIRAFESADLEQVIALDRDYSARSRRGYFEKRMEAMRQEPQAFIGLVADDGARVVGFVLARVLEGEFGGEESVAVLDALAVASDAQRRGLGGDLLQALISEVRSRGGRALRTQVHWSQSDILRFFQSAGLSLAPRWVLERSTANVTF